MWAGNGGVGGGAESDQAEKFELSLKSKEHRVDGFRKSSRRLDVCMR